MTATTIIMIGLAGGLGALARYLLSGFISQHTSKAPVPIATGIINCLGSFVLGVLTARLLHGSTALLMWGTGFCGGFTTFSTAFVEFVVLGVERARYVAMVVLIAAMVLGALGCAGLGLWLGSL